MATEIIATLQGTAETRTHFIDFTADLPGTVTVSSATATHTPPSGSAGTPTVGVIASGIVPITVGPLTVTGRHIVAVTATLSDAEQVTARLIIPVQWDAARAGMSAIIQELRGLVDSGSDDYKIGGIPYWTDKQLQDVLDRYAYVYDFETLSEQARREGTSTVYKVYETGVQFWEASPIIYDGTGGTITTGYTFDARLGRVTFTADQQGSARVIGGTAYDVNAAASDVWRTKSAHVAQAYDFSTDNHSLSRSQLIRNYQSMSAMYASMALSGGALYARRTDTDA